MDGEEYVKNMLMLKQADRERSEIHRDMMRAYKNETLPLIEPHWHVCMDKVDLSWQRDKFHPSLLIDGFTILPEINIDRLLSKMSPGNIAMFSKKELYSTSFNDRTISDILYFWANGQRLIPPTIIVFNKDYMKTLELDCPTSRKFQPVDGKHRLNVSFSLDAKLIPILIWKRQLSLIERMLA